MRRGAKVQVWWQNTAQSPICVCTCSSWCRRACVRDRASVVATKKNDREPSENSIKTEVCNPRWSAHRKDSLWVSSFNSVSQRLLFAQNPGARFFEFLGDNLALLGDLTSFEKKEGNKRDDKTHHSSRSVWCRRTQSSKSLVKLDKPRAWEGELSLRTRKKGFNRLEWRNVVHPTP